MRSLEELIMKYKPLDFLCIALEREKKKKKKDRNMPDLT